MTFDAWWDEFGARYHGDARMIAEAAWDFSSRVAAGTTGMPVRHAVAGLVTAVVEREGATGLVLGGVEWKAGMCDGDQSHPRARDLRVLEDEEIIRTIDGVAGYIESIADAR